MTAQEAQYSLLAALCVATVVAAYIVVHFWNGGETA